MRYNIQVRKSNVALAQLDRVFGYEPKGRGFESLMPRQKKDAELFPILCPFSTKSTLWGGRNRIHDEIPLAWDEIRLDGGWVDLISSEAVGGRFHPSLRGFHLL